MYRDVIVKNLYVYAQKKKRAKERESARMYVQARSVWRMRGRTSEVKEKRKEE
jgi:hypothetical protein